MKVSVRSHRLFLVSVFALVLLGSSINDAMACRSYAEKIEDAIEFCTKELNCQPPLEMQCGGKTREWKCLCKKPKKEAIKKPEQKKESDYSIKKEMDKSSPKLMEDK